MADDTLTVRFASPDALRDEFEKNIANRGVFVETEASFEVRQEISVEVVLDYGPEAGTGAPALVLDGEVVHVLPPEMAASGAKPGVAVQLEASASALRERFEPLLGQEASESASPDRNFTFEPTAEESLLEAATPNPLDTAILDAACFLDEEGQGDVDVDCGAASSADDEPLQTIPIEGTTTFEIDFEQEELSRSSLDMTEGAVLELAKAGITVERLCYVIPESEAQVRSAVEGLVEMGVLVPR